MRASSGLRPLVCALAALGGGGGLLASEDAGRAEPELAEVPVLERILSHHQGLSTTLERSAELRIQIVLGVLEDQPDGSERLVQHGYRLDAEYFYPASSIKLFAAVAALERLATLRAETGLPLDLDTALVYHPQFEGETRVDADTSNLAGGTVTVRHEIRKLFLVSDNEAFNRLYELVGPDHLAASLERAGVRGARIVHRLDEARTPEQNRQLPAIDFVIDGKVAWSQPARVAAEPPPIDPVAGIEVGDGYLDGAGARVDGAMDFSAKNRIPLAELQRGLCLALRPELDCGVAGEAAGFALSPDDHERLLEAASELPGDSLNPRYDRAEYPDSYGKPLLAGLARVLDPRRVRIANKTGRAYGFSIENALVEDRASGRAFFVAATIYTNSNGILNDDDYDYRSVADPFLADLGEALARWFWGPPSAIAAPAPAASESP